MSCVICLVIAREMLLLQSDCSAITKVRNFSLLSLTRFVNDKLKQTLKTEDTLYKLHIFRHRPICGLFPLECRLYGRLFNESFTLYYSWRNVSTAFAVGLSGQNEAKFQNNLESFSSLPSIFCLRQPARTFGFFGSSFQFVSKLDPKKRMLSQPVSQEKRRKTAEHAIMKKIFIQNLFIAAQVYRHSTKTKTFFRQRTYPPTEAEAVFQLNTQIQPGLKAKPPFLYLR